MSTTGVTALKVHGKIRTLESRIGPQRTSIPFRKNAQTFHFHEKQRQTILVIQRTAGSYNSSLCSTDGGDG